MHHYIYVFLKGLAMGIANVIPGVSGGTIALITGIFERIINAIKNTLSIESARLIFTGKFSKWLKHTDLVFAMVLGAGIIIAIVSVARLFEYLFAVYPAYLWAFFFGLVLASVWFVGRTVSKWNAIVVLFFAFGTAVAVLMAVLKPMGENTGFMYLILCGAVAACSMILPGVSGSFVLILMGNYELVMIKAVNDVDLSILIPVFIGAGVGLIGFSYILSWIFRKFRNQTIATLSGFMFGSLLIIWPWKIPVWKTGNDGELILSRSGDKIVENYHWTHPEDFNTELLIALAFIVIGIAVIAVTETIAARNKKQSTE